jgi:hypothetical protein
LKGGLEGGIQYETLENNEKRKKNRKTLQTITNNNAINA